MPNGFIVLGKRSLQTRPDLLVLLLACALLLLHVFLEPERYRQLLPLNVKSFQLVMSFQGDGRDVTVSTFVPRSDHRQLVLSRQVEAGSLNFQIREEDAASQLRIEGDDVRYTHSVRYRASLALQPLDFQLDDPLPIPARYSSGFEPYLAGTGVIQVWHPAIAELWRQIQPDDPRNARALVRAIFDYTHGQLETVPFKDTTDAVTALRLGQASCNGKSRLLVALARLNRLPSRLVGGVILNNGRKRIPHQWAEVFLGDHWVPFDPANGHFARLPANYLTLYRGDQALFSHTANINFDYQFDIHSRTLAAGLYSALVSPELNDPLNAMGLLTALGLDEKIAVIFLLFPFCALLVTFFRNVVGLQSFGVFMPILVAAACRYTGLPLGIGVFGAVLFTGWLSYRLLDQARLLNIPRLAVVITIITLSLLVLLAITDLARSPLEMGIIVLFPVVVIVFAAERLHQMVQASDWRHVLSIVSGSLLLIGLCYLAFDSLLLQGLFALYPELFLLVLAGQLWLGRWTGVRVNEFWRFFRLIRFPRGQVPGSNRPEFIRRVDDKLLCKNLLREQGIPVTDTLFVYATPLDCQSLEQDLSSLDSLVIKPARGSQGRSILLLTRREGAHWLTADGKSVNRGFIHHHLLEIIAGGFSDSHSDTALVEPLLQQPPAFNQQSPFGFSDIRILLHQGEPVMAMWRLPTQRSRGCASIQQGAIDVSLDLQNGKTRRALLAGKPLSKHPDTGVNLINLTIPQWPALLRLARDCYQTIPLDLLAVDLGIDAQRGPLVLDINARPGLEIQNVRGRGMADLFFRLHSSITTGVGG